MSAGVADFIIPTYQLTATPGIVIDNLSAGSVSLQIKAASTPVVDFTTAFEGTAGAGGNVAYMAERTFLPIGFQCVALSKDLYGTLVVRNAYTPIANEIFTIRLNIEQD